MAQILLRKFWNPVVLVNNVNFYLPRLKKLKRALISCYEDEHSPGAKPFVCLTTAYVIQIFYP